MQKGSSYIYKKEINIERGFLYLGWWRMEGEGFFLRFCPNDSLASLDLSYEDTELL